jgi:hypothetical protein
MSRGIERAVGEGGKGEEPGHEEEQALSRKSGDERREDEDEADRRSAQERLPR